MTSMLRVFTVISAVAASTLTIPSAGSAQEPPPFTLPAWETEGDFAELPHPRDVFGFEPGADYLLATHAQVVEYFQRLAAASDRVHVEEIGRSVLGRPLILAYVSSASNIARLEELRRISESLGRGRVSAEEAATLVRDGKAVVWIDGGLHSTEVAATQHAPLLAWRVAAEESEEMRRIRDDVVLLLMPVLNPDGLDLVADWTERSLGTPWEGTAPPVLYHAYAGHDNNRDWFMITQPETRAVARVLYDEWYPQIVYNQHQTAPWPARIFIPPFAEPLNPNIPPLVVRGVNLVGKVMGKRLAEEGKPGAISGIQFDMWWNGGMRTAPYFHNMVGILTETAHASVSPRHTPRASLPRFIGAVPTLQPSIFYPEPWEGGWFRMRDAMEYMVTASMATLDVASRLRADWLRNIWRMGADAVAAGEAGGPFAYVIPPDQWDRREAVELVNVLRRGGVEVHRAEAGFTADGESFPAGSYLVFAGQAFRPHIIDLLEPQVYPDVRIYPGGPPERPYDISGWTLPIQMNVRAVRVDDPIQVRAVAVNEARVWPGRVVGTGRAGWALSAASNASALAVNRLLAAGARVAIAPDGVMAAGRDLGPGAYLIRNADPDLVQRLAHELGLELVALDRAYRGPLREVQRPRIGLYATWQANRDEGWTRWVLEQYEFPVDTLRDADIRRGDLSAYHAIILPDQRPDALLSGFAPGSRPAHMTGGLGRQGVAALRDYVRAGGRLVAFDAATDFLIEQLDLPLRNAVAGLSSDEFFIPGTLIRMRLGEGPVTYGMPDEAAAFFVRSRAFELDGAPANVDVAARYAESDLVLSGWALGEEEHLAGRVALARVGVGAGDVVLFGFRPQFRGQPRGTFRLIFNALHGATVPAPVGEPVY